MTNAIHNHNSEGPTHSICLLTKSIQARRLSEDLIANNSNLSQLSWRNELSLALELPEIHRQYKSVNRMGCRTQRMGKHRTDPPMPFAGTG